MGTKEHLTLLKHWEKAAINGHGHQVVGEFLVPD